MTNNEIQNTKRIIIDRLKNNRINQALPLILSLLEYGSSWQLSEEFEKIKLEYEYMLHYFMSGSIDNERENIYNGFIHRLYAIVDKVENHILTREGYGLYFSTKRTIKKNAYSLSELLNRYDVVFSEVNLYSEIDKNKQDKDTYIDLLTKKEDLECNIFKYVWTSYPVSSVETDIIKDIFTSDRYPGYFKELILSAVFLSLMQFYDEHLFITLLHNYNSVDNKLSVKSLCAAVIILFCYKDRISSSIEVCNAFKLYEKNDRFITDFKTILYLLIRSKNTEKITQKVEKELFPKLMKIYPKVFKKFKGGHASIDLSDLESNPQWKDILEDNGITKKIEELNKLQMEGGDVFIGTFSHLKSFPFFNEISNWFLPFNKNHSMLLSTFNDNDIKLTDLILNSQFFCDSDKFSFTASLASVPVTQRNMMLGQFDEQNSALQELRNSELPMSDAIKRENIANSYIQNIYRFFKLYTKRNEFTDPFNNEFDVTELEYKKYGIDFTDTLSVVAEFYLKNGYYKDAIKYFSAIQDSGVDTNSANIQKLGFCYQNIEDYDNAIDCYKKYELLTTGKDLWNCRHIAACFKALKKIDKALEYYYEADKLSQDNVSINLNIGHCLLEMGKTEDALKSYYKVYYLEPSSPRIWRPIAWCLFLTGNYEQSHIFYDKIVQEKPTSIDFLNLGHLYFAEGNIPQAISMYKKSIIIDEKITIDNFLENFNADEAVLLSLGIKKSNIALLVDSILYEYKS